MFIKNMYCININNFIPINNYFNLFNSKDVVLTYDSRNKYFFNPFNIYNRINYNFNNLQLTEKYNYLNIYNAIDKCIANNHKLLYFNQIYSVD